MIALIVALMLLCGGVAIDACAEARQRDTYGRVLCCCATGNGGTCCGEVIYCPGPVAGCQCR